MERRVDLSMFGTSTIGVSCSTCRSWRGRSRSFWARETRIRDSLRGRRVETADRRPNYDFRALRLSAQASVGAFEKFHEFGREAGAMNQ